MSKVRSETGDPLQKRRVIPLRLAVFQKNAVRRNVGRGFGRAAHRDLKPSGDQLIVQVVDDERRSQLKGFAVRRGERVQIVRQGGGEQNPFVRHIAQFDRDRLSTL